MTALITQQASNLPALISASGEKVAVRFIEFFTANIHNPNTRRAYAKGIGHFMRWCEAQGIVSLATITPVHVAIYIKELSQTKSAPTTKQRLAAIRMLFDWLVTGGTLPMNPAHAVRGPKHRVKRGKTPVLTGEEARQILDAIDVSQAIGQRDRALIGLMTYTFARIGAALAMNVDDVFVQAGRMWIRLHEKGGKEHEMPCHHNLEDYLNVYIKGQGLSVDLKRPLFPTIGRGTSALTTHPMSQKDAYAMIGKRALRAKIETKVCNHTFRATGITAYFKNNGTLEKAANMANHFSTRTTQLYDRRNDDITLDEIEKIQI
ncbi:MAG: tyrosine-type recombinase/integrase [Aestuariivirga sp.]